VLDPFEFQCAALPAILRIPCSAGYLLRCWRDSNGCCREAPCDGPQPHGWRDIPIIVVSAACAITQSMRRLGCVVFFANRSTSRAPRCRRGGAATKGLCVSASVDAVSHLKRSLDDRDRKCQVNG
jgi:hypothetical protein